MDEVKDLKTFAKEAKIRFKKGFWKDYNKRKEEKIELAKENGINEKEIIKIETEKARRDIKSQFSEKSEDDFLYERVVEILSSGEIVLNPINRLIDKDKYASLSDFEKQRYILSLTEKFNECKQRYEKESKVI